MSDQANNNENGKVGGGEFTAWGSERRKAVRASQARQVVIYPCKSEGLGRAIRCSMTDQSSTGVGLACLGSMAVGTKFVLRIDQPAGPPQLLVHHVVRCRDAGGGACQVGAQFHHAFSGANPAAADDVTTRKLAS